MSDKVKHCKKKKTLITFWSLLLSEIGEPKREDYNNLCINEITDNLLQCIKFSKLFLDI